MSRRPFLPIILGLAIILAAAVAILWLWRNITHVEDVLPITSLHRERDFSSLLLDMVKLQSAGRIALQDPSPEALSQADFALDMAVLRLNDNESLYGSDDRAIRTLQTSLAQELEGIERSMARTPPDLQALEQQLDMLSVLLQDLRHLNDITFQDSMQRISDQREHLSGLRHWVFILIGLFAMASLMLIASLYNRLKNIRLLESQQAEIEQRESLLRENESLLHTVIDEMPDVLVLKDHKGDFLLCNQTVAKLVDVHLKLTHFRV